MPSEHQRGEMATTASMAKAAVAAARPMTPCTKQAVVYPFSRSEISFLYNVGTPSGVPSLFETCARTVAGAFTIQQNVFLTLTASVRMQVLRWLAKLGDVPQLYVYLSDVERFFELVMALEVRVELIACCEWLRDAWSPIMAPILQALRLRAVRGSTDDLLTRAYQFGLFFQEVGWFDEAAEMLDFAIKVSVCVCLSGSDPCWRERRSVVHARREGLHAWQIGELVCVERKQMEVREMREGKTTSVRKRWRERQIDR